LDLGELINSYFSVAIILRITANCFFARHATMPPCPPDGIVPALVAFFHNAILLTCYSYWPISQSFFASYLMVALGADLA
jgi:hypothetical protein